MKGKTEIERVKKVAVTWSCYKPFFTEKNCSLQQFKMHIDTNDKMFWAVNIYDIYYIYTISISTRGDVSIDIWFSLS